MGPANETPDGRPLPMTIEPRPGGRWFRDLGGDNGHFWGLVQAIKRPTLLEITGPLFMSSAVISNVQYRLTEVGGGTVVAFRHSAFGFVPDELREGLSKRLDRSCSSGSVDRLKAGKTVQRRRVIMSVVNAMLQELEQEARTTRRVLERVPGDRLGWKPHDKSMSLGQLALHVATTSGHRRRSSRLSPDSAADGFSSRARRARPN